MSKEKKFHALIEQQNREKKVKAWNAISDKINEGNDVEAVHNHGAAVAAMKKRTLIPLSAVAAILFMAICLTLIFLLPGNKKLKYRFCNSDDYSFVSTEETLREYSLRTGKPLLFFDWYDMTVSCFSDVVELDATKEIICFRETMLDMNRFLFVTLYVTDNRTEIDFLESYKSKCDSTFLLNNITVEWGKGNSIGYAKFEYEGFRYYLEIQADSTGELISNYVAELLS